MNRPALKLVAEPEDDLRDLFAREAALLRELADIRRLARQPLRRYAEKHGLIMLPRIERLRRELAQ